MLNFTHTLWHEHSSNAIKILETAHLPQSTDESALRMLPDLLEVALYASKSLGLLLSHGVPDIDTREEVLSIFSQLVQILEGLMKCFPAAEQAGWLNNDVVRNSVEGLLDVLSLIVLDVQRKEPLGFRVYLRSFLEYFSR
eukprot:GABV01010625.1.p1 GENE.GABV01010625.1~~GABV01010625.1.p1  ORF type:complete len:148 (+),score=42.97 GABV01010625.1:26-445(+)